MELRHSNITEEKQVKALITEYGWNYNKAKPDFIALNKNTLNNLFGGRDGKLCGITYILDEDIENDTIILIES